MASSNSAALISIAITIFLFKPVTSDSYTSNMPPLFDNICNEVECGRGYCKLSLDSPFLFECECEPGWIQANSHHDQDFFKFLPCLIPDCTLDYDCAKIPYPDYQEREEIPKNSPFDPCYWSDCGVGTCKRISQFKHECECQEGYNNLLNVTSFPCFRECALGVDCARLGVAERTFFPQNASFIDHSGINQVNSAMKEEESIKWWFMTAVSMTLILYN